MSEYNLPAQETPEAMAAHAVERERANAWYRVSDQLIARMKKAIYDEAGTCDYTFPEGNVGDVVGAPDAAVVTARAAFDIVHEIVAAIEAYPGARGPAIDDPRDPRRAGLDTARRIARDLGKAATT